MKGIVTYILTLVILMLGISVDAQASTRRERKLITQGNKLYTQRQFVEAASIYEKALKENPQSTSAIYNLGLAQLRQVKNVADTTPKNQTILANARKNLAAAAQRSKERPGIAAKANYNLGNLEFNSKEYQKAIDYYKQSLRIDPNDENARRNLRIAQKQLQKQNQDKNKDNQKQDQDKKDLQDKKDQQKQDQQQQKQDQKQDQQKQQPKDQEINQQTAERILQAMDNKENQTRARVNRATKGDKTTGGGRSVKRW